MQSLEQNVTLYGNKDVTRSESIKDWSGVTPKLLRNQAVYELSYAPGNPPPPVVHASILRTFASESAVAPKAIPPEAIREDPGVSGAEVHVRRHLVQEDTGLVLMAVALVVGFVQGGALKRLVPRFGETRLIFAGGLIATLGFALVPFAHSFWTLIFVACIVALGFSFISPCLRGLVSRDTAAHRQGSIGGITESVRSFAMAAGPLAGGWLFDLGHALPFWLGAGCMFAAGLVVLTLRSDSHSAEGLITDPVEPY
jgi:MFS family permease